ncbi:hypothetical protein [Nonomuraea insulae]|uniref:hypothetical protein n=1 Tax=Nonomuraea insulae TaxID=1616787 RepID=UPI0036D2F46F
MHIDVQAHVHVVRHVAQERVQTLRVTTEMEAGSWGPPASPGVVIRASRLKASLAIITLSGRC